MKKKIQQLKKQTQSFLLLALFAVTTSLFLSSCMVGGDEIGNGGDVLPKLFASGRKKAQDILEKVTTLEEVDLEGVTKTRKQQIQDFYRQNRKTLQQEVETSPIIWVKKNSNHACGKTGSRAGSVIYLAYHDETCRKTIQTVLDAAIHLIGEAVHHHGVQDDSFTAELSVSVRNAWLRSLENLEFATALRLSFETGRKFASEMILRIDRSQVPSFYLNEQVKINTEELDFLMALQNRQKISASILEEKHIWVDELPPLEHGAPRCVQWQRNEATQKAELHLSYSGCNSSLQTQQISHLLITAALISFWDSEREPMVSREEKAVRFTNLIHATWANQGHLEKPHLISCKHSPLFALKASHSAWMGHWMANWFFQKNEDGKYQSQFGIYSPRKNNWSEIFSIYIEGNFKTLSQHRASAWLPKEQTLISLPYCEERKENENITIEETGFQLQIPFLPKNAAEDIERIETISFNDKQSWQPIPSSPSGSGIKLDQREFVILPLDHRALIWKGKKCNAENSFADWLLYNHNHKEARFTSLHSLLPQNLREQIQQGEVLSVIRKEQTHTKKSQFLVWTTNNDGWIFDLDDVNNIAKSQKIDRPPQSWIHFPLSKEDSHAIWTDNSLLVFSLEDQRSSISKQIKEGVHVNFSGVGVTPTWEKMQSPPSHSLSSLLFKKMVWARPYVLIPSNPILSYHVGQKKWIPLERLSFPRENSAFQLIWTGMEVLFWTGGQDDRALFF